MQKSSISIKATIRWSWKSIVVSESVPTVKNVTLEGNKLCYSGIFTLTTFPTMTERLDVLQCIFDLINIGWPWIIINRYSTIIEVLSDNIIIPIYSDLTLHLFHQFIIENNLLFL